jgi:hypothetical protein
LEPYLLDSIVEFDVCNQSLAYTTTGSATDGFFGLDLTLENKVLLSKIMILGWLSRNIQETLQMQNFITDRDFKTFSAAQNLSAKVELYNMKREEVNQAITDYGYRHNSWTDWRNQNFST